MRPEYQQTVGNHSYDVMPGILGEMDPLAAPKPICIGRVRAVDPERWVATVDFEGTNQNQFDIPIMNTYFHHQEGQGLYFIPELGSRCVLAFLQDTWAIIGYLPPIDPRHSDKLAEQNRKTQSVNKAYERAADKNASESTGIGEDETPNTKSYRNGRESDMGPGDFCVKTKAYNKSKWFTTGNILHESTKLCWRLYSAENNVIEDRCVNYALRTPGGLFRWTNEVKTGESDTRRDVKRFSSERYSSFVERVGHDVDVFERMVRHWEKVDDDVWIADYLPDEGSVAYLPEHFREHIGKDGMWTRRVNHNKVKDADATIDSGEAFSDPKAAYYITVQPNGTLDEVVNDMASTKKGFSQSINVGSFDGQGKIQSWTTKVNDDTASGETKYFYDVQEDGTTTRTIRKGPGSAIGWQEVISPDGTRVVTINASSPGTHVISYLADGTKIVNQAKDQVKTILGAKTSTISEDVTNTIKGAMANTISKNMVNSVKRNVSEQIKGLAMKNIKRAKIDVSSAIQLKLGRKFQFLNMLPTLPGIGALPIPLSGLTGIMPGLLSGALGSLNGLAGIVSQVQGLSPASMLSGLTSSLTSGVLGAINGAVGNLASGALGALGQATGVLGPLGSSVQGFMETGVGVTGLVSQMSNLGSLTSSSVLGNALASISSAVSGGSLDANIASVASNFGTSLASGDIDSFRDTALASFAIDGLSDINLDNAVSTFASGATSIQDFKDNFLGSTVNSVVGLMDAASAADGVGHMVGNFLVSAVVEKAEEIVDS